MSSRLRLAVVAGGAIGTAIRWALSTLPAVGGIPTGTLTANLLGALALGAVVGRFAGHPPASWTPVTAGLLGAATTYSAFVVELATGWRTAPLGMATYVGLSLAGGVAAALAGRRLAAGAHG